MTAFRSVDIDIAVHKCVEAARERFDESPNDIFRRLLGIEGTVGAKENVPVDVSAGRAWSGKGVVLPHGTAVRMEYNGKEHTGQIDNGEWLVEGTRYNSPSAAADGVSRTRAGTSPSLNGWIYWQVKRPGDTKWIGLQSLRSIGELA